MDYLTAKARIISYLLSPETQDRSIDTHVIAEATHVDYYVVLAVLDELHGKGLISRDK
ncbi:MAG: hypothetical protein ACXQS4_02095 [Methermicoccaceae archaeon]